MRAWLAAKLPQVWLQRRWPAQLLWPVSRLYAFLTGLRRGLYGLGLLQTSRLPVAVIVVGNVVTGGSGKTPVVMAIVDHLRSRGLVVGVVSRGYGRTTQHDLEVVPGSSARMVGDEPALIHHRCQVPVFVAAKRVEAAQALLARYPATQVIVCDDGLQHLALARDIEICVFDDRGVGNGWLLPAGPLRENWPRRADFVVHSGQHPAFAGWHADRRLGAYAVRADGSRLPLQSFRNVPVLAVAGIARPQAFFDMLRTAGLHLDPPIALPDHYDFTHWHPPKGAATTLLCTEKDAVKLWPHYPDAWAIPLQLTLEPGLLAQLDRLLAPQVPSRPVPPTRIPHGQQTS